MLSIIHEGANKQNARNGKESILDKWSFVDESFYKKLVEGYGSATLEER